MTRELLAIAAALALGQSGVFYLAALRCELQLRRSEPEQEASRVRALVVTDVHLLGKRRRSAVERAWIDWQVQQSVSAAVAVHRPDVVLVLGDQFDEGSRPTPDRDWQEYVDRFFAVFAHAAPLQSLYLIGNHDASFGRYMSAAEIKRYEVAFGASNRIDFVDGHLFVSLNTMALDADVANMDVKMQSRSFLDDLDFERLRARTTGQVVLLTHVPLYRADDMQCGEARRSEGGHVTYEDPSFQYEVHHHVLSPGLSTELLAKIQPDVVLSGHTHAWCALQHPDGAAEFTTPAFSWGQRPDPSYTLLQLGHDKESLPISATKCDLPREPLVFALYGATLVFVVLSLVWRCCRARVVRNSGKEKQV